MCTPTALTTAPFYTGLAIKMGNYILTVPCDDVRGISSPFTPGNRKIIKS